MYAIHSASFDEFILNSFVKQCHLIFIYRFASNQSVQCYDSSLSWLVWLGLVVFMKNVLKPPWRKQVGKSLIENQSGHCSAPICTKNTQI